MFIYGSSENKGKAINTVKKKTEQRFMPRSLHGTNNTESIKQRYEYPQGFFDEVRVHYHSHDQTPMAGIENIIQCQKDPPSETEPVTEIKDMTLVELVDSIISAEEKERGALLLRYSELVEKIPLEELVSFVKIIREKMEQYNYLFRPIGKRYWRLMQPIYDFVRTMGVLGLPYALSEKYGSALQPHELFENISISLYPIEKTQSIQGPYRNFVHRPILDIEFVGDIPYARCYLTMYAPAPVETTLSATGKGKEELPEYKDITAGEDGIVTLQNVSLMNLGNPAKALLWAEDYVLNSEHHLEKQDKDRMKKGPHPVVRSFLVPLEEAIMLLTKKGRGIAPVDQDRGAGQFKDAKNDNIYDRLLNPLKGSLASFFYKQEDYDREPDSGQTKFDMADLQQFVTGHRGEVDGLATKGIAAQYGRDTNPVEFADDYMPFFSAYYDSVDNQQTGFTGAVSSKSLPRSKDFIRKKEVLTQKLPLKTNVSILKEIERCDRKPEHQLQVEALEGLFYNNLVAVSTSVENERVKAENEERGRQQAQAAAPHILLEPDSSAQIKADEDLAAKLASGGDVEGDVIFPADRFVLSTNVGGGNCLFYALEGMQTMELPALIGLRQQVAAIRRQEADDEVTMRRNAHSMEQTARQSLVLARATTIMPNIFLVPNAVLADMQAIPGVYGGQEEIEQWAILKRKTVIAIHDYGRIFRYTPDGQRVKECGDANNPVQIQAWISEGLIVIYQSANHWQRVEAAR